MIFFLLFGDVCHESQPLKASPKPRCRLCNPRGGVLQGRQLHPLPFLHCRGGEGTATGDSNGGESQEETGADGNFGEKNGNSDWEKMWDWECYENTYIAERTMVTASPLLVVTWDALRII